MCACHLFNDKLIVNPTQGVRKNTAIMPFFFLKSVNHERQETWTSCASLNVFIYNATRKIKKSLISVHRQAEGGFNTLASDRLMHIFTKNILLKTLLLFVYLTTLPLHFVLYWIHVARTGYLSSWRKCIIFRPN